MASVLNAALARTQPEGTEPDGAESVPIKSEDVTVIQMPVTNAPVATIGGRVTTGSDWTATIGLVERAASTIKAYERRFVELDIHTRALIERSQEEQQRLQEEIQNLEGRLRDAEDRLARAEMVARDEAFYRWEADRRLREAETRLADAEDFSRQSEDYLRRVHSVLAEI